MSRQANAAPMPTEEDMKRMILGIEAEPPPPAAGDVDMSHLQLPRAPVTARDDIPIVPQPRNTTREPMHHASVEGEEAELLRELDEIDREKRLQGLRARLAKERKQLDEARSARANVPLHDEVRDSINTWILMPYEQHEETLAKAWIDEHCPLKSDQRMIESVIDVNQLRKEDSIICMVRGAKRGGAVPRLSHHRDPQSGAMLHEEKDPFVLFADVTLSKAVHCKDYWLENAGHMRYGGMLDRNALVCALGPLISPMAPRWLDANMAVNGNKPNLLILRDM